ncbi:MAG: VCBS repeat-containing protein [Saprospiraceae bacterium]
MKKQSNTNHNWQHLQKCCAIVVLLSLILTNCQTKSTTPKLFKKLKASHTNINFKNQITENDTHNILNFTNLYTGSGVGIGDFNNDGLQDIFFGGNMESSRLYLNKGNLKFEDITEKANIKTDRWITGVSVVDINNDGWEDVYLCVSGNANMEQRKNLLFINNQDNTFTEQTENYGIADTSQCTNANFFDYDKDGDLDMIVIVNPTDYKLFNVNTIRKKKVNGESKSTDKLYQNNGDGTFTNVSAKAGILIEGYSLGLNVSDLNNDSWSDIYVTNDFMTNDIVYINNQDGTFTNRAAEMLKHTSFASMGIDVADINNDGNPEIYVLDMLPEDNYRQKMIAGSDNYDRFEYMIKTGYEPQYSRNTLQLNNGDGTFSEIGQLANIHKTDWSWSALFADYDNDGLKDLFVTNGFRRDLGDLDYINYTNTNPFGNPEARKKDQLKRILEQPGAKLSNYIYKNENGLTFSKKSIDWGIDEPSYSHGASYADLDNDGDLDLVVNNVSQEAFIYENQANTLLENNYLKVAIETKNQSSGDSKSPDDLAYLGTKVTLFYNNQIQYAELTPYRGYQSTVEKTLHFGLGKIGKVDSIKVNWTNGKSTTIKDVKVNQTIEISPNFKLLDRQLEVVHPIAKQLFQPINLFNYTHQEDVQIDFNLQSLLPHQHSKNGPCIAVADVNNDGLKDIFIGGSAGFSGTFFIQEKGKQTISHQVTSSHLMTKFREVKLNQDIEKEDTDCLFFDADNDGDLDLYVVSGSVIYSNQNDIYQDRIYINDNGNFVKNDDILPKVNSSGSIVIATDYDNDGDQDLFIGGRVTPTKYPIIPNSYLLENNNGKFKDVTSKSLKNVGMVTDAIWADIDNDEDDDLIIVGEFMPITIFENQNGIINYQLSIVNSNGWWNCVKQGDFDNDGDIDFIAGNLGLNTNFRASKGEPVCLYANDFDKNESIDPVMCQYVDGVEIPIPSRDKLIKQIPPIKVRFTTYKNYANAGFSDVFKKAEKKNMQVLEANEMQSCYIENVGNGQFKIHHLPIEMQFAPINDFLIEDVNQDGNLDVLAVGNNYSTEVGQGRYDAFTGALMLGDGKGNFEVKRGESCGLKADKDAKTIKKLRLENKKTIYIIGNNSADLQIFMRRKTQEIQ